MSDAGTQQAQARQERGAPPDAIRALLIGGGGREHALAWALRRSPRVDALYATHTDNPGIASLSQGIDCDRDLKDLWRLSRACDAAGVNLIVVGPEGPLAAGFADRLAKPGRAVVGPGAEGAQLEASKAWAKRLMRSASIPTGDARVFTDTEEAKDYLRSRRHRHVVKASGLAAGKGVVVPANLDEALRAVDALRAEFPEASREILIEELLEGPEASVFALTDGRTIAMLETCQDHKRLLEGDAGPNTGGMGAYCPARVLSDAQMARVQREILVPLVDALRRDDIEYRGVIYAGLMLTPAGPKVLEFNVRFGDPECQALMALYDGDVADLLWRTASGSLDGAEIGWRPGSACCVVLASQGYPADPRKGQPIEGLDEAAAVEGVTLFHAGTRRAPDGSIVVAGGRVLNVVAVADTLAEARERANRAADLVRFEGKIFRRDIGAKAP